VAGYKVTASTKLELDGVRIFESLKQNMQVEVKANRASSELIEVELED
jgi:hypothetical protein